MARRALDGNGSHTLDGTEEDDLLVGHRFNETINGFGGNDTLIGGYGSDELNGGDGDDLIGGNIGDVDNAGDDLYGGAGADRFAFYHPGASLDAGGMRDKIFDFEKGTDKIDFTGEFTAALDPEDITVDHLHGDLYRIYAEDPAWAPGQRMAIDAVSVLGAPDPLTDFLYAV